MKAVVNIFGEIGVDVKLIDVVSQMKNYPNPEELEVNINSVGGYVDQGDDIYNYLESFNLPTTTIANGMCASFATKLMLLGSTRKVVKGTRFMIHNPFLNGLKGDADLLRGYSEELKKIENNLLGFYAEKLNQSKLAIQPLMKRETFLSNEELLTLGFATEIVEGQAKEVKLKAVAKLNINQNENQMSVEIDEKSQKSLLAKIEGMIKNAFNPKSMLELTDGKGNVLMFPDLEPEQTPEVGSKAQAEDGTYEIEGKVYTIENSEVVAIEEVEAGMDEEKEKMQAELEKKEEELEQMKAKLSETTAKLKEKEEVEAATKAELTEIKNTVASWNPSKKPQPQASVDKKQPKTGLTITRKK